MPLYEYVCQSCGTHFEKIVRFSEPDPDATCPVCRSDKTHKLISLFAASGPGTQAASSASCSSSSGGFR